MAVADSLARTHHTRLVLISRHAESASAEHEAQFAEWRRLGAEVLLVSADTTDRESMRRAVSLAREKFGSINGILHAAGFLQDGIIQLKKKLTSHAVLAPKIEGVQILDELTRDEPLDFFALFSSVSALVPPAGQVDYCAANAFLNAFAQSQPAGRNFIVIGWGPWSEVGMVAPKSDVAGESISFSHRLLERVDLDTTAQTVYSGNLSVEHHWVLSEHHFHGGDSLLPGTAHLEIAVTAFWKKIGQQPIALENVVFLAPLRVLPQETISIRAELQKTEAGYQFSVTTGDVIYVTGQCSPSPGTIPRLELTTILARCSSAKIDSPKNIRQNGHFDFGPRWQSLRSISFGKNECVGLVEIPPDYHAEISDFALHPALMDIATGVAMFLIPGYGQAGDLLLPFAYQKLNLYGVLSSRVYSHARIHPDSNSELVTFDLTLARENGDVVAEIKGFTIKRLRSVAGLERHSTSLPPGTVRIVKPASPHNGIPTQDGLEIFRRILKSRPSGVIYVSPTTLSPAPVIKENESSAYSVTAGDGDIEQVLKQLWQRLLGLERVDAKTDFFDSGGHSLLAVRLFTEIRKRFNVDLGLSTLFEARTIGALADLIRKAREADPAHKSATPARSLVSIRSGSSSTPLFLIHDVGGSVLRYEHLARHFPDSQSIFAIESRGLSGHPADFSVEEMARHYVQQIRERQPQGPYFVAGHSFGGMVAYEIARQLITLGEKMGLVGLLDTYQSNITEEDSRTGSPGAPLRSDKLSVVARLKKDIHTMLMGHNRIGYLLERKTFIQAWFHKALYRTAYNFTVRQGGKMPGFLNDVKEANWIALDNFTPGTYEGAVVLFRCKNRLDTDPPDSAHVWKRLVKGEVIILETPGDHNSILKEPNVGTLANQILSFLQTPAASAKSKVEMNVIGISGLEQAMPFKRRQWPNLDERDYRISQGHDAAAALICSGEIIAAAAEERFNRHKQSAQFPARAIAWCLEHAGLELKDIDAIAHGFDYAPYREIYSLDPVTKEFYDTVLSPEALRTLIKRDLKTFPLKNVHHVPHHFAHAASAYYTSGWDDCLVAVIDAMGEAHGTSIFRGQAGKLERIAASSAQDSIGIFYSLITLHLGFDFNSDEYKIMGLAPYGNPARFREFFDREIVLRDNGTIRIPSLRLNKTRDERENYLATRDYLNKNLIPARPPAAEITGEHRDIAAALQECLNKVLIHICGSFGQSTGLRHLALAGGVALNCTANGHLLRSGLFDEIYAQPASGDDGTALGAGLYYTAQQGDVANRRMIVPMLGPAYDEKAIQDALTAFSGIIDVQKFGSLEETCTAAAGLIGKGSVLAWYRGRMEFGPRALGNRSILADPGHPEMRDRINAMVKKREAFRPFAPAVSQEEVDRWFDVCPGTKLPYMITIVDVREQWRAALPAITHVNGSARVQTVSAQDNPAFHQLLQAVGKTTGRQMVLNTSFNVKGQPIVNTPTEAIETFLGTGIDCLFLENHLVTRKAQQK